MFETKIWLTDTNYLRKNPGLAEENNYCQDLKKKNHMIHNESHTTVQRITIHL